VKYPITIPKHSHKIAFSYYSNPQKNRCNSVNCQHFSPPAKWESLDFNAATPQLLLFLRLLRLPGCCGVTPNEDAYQRRPDRMSERMPERMSQRMSEFMCEICLQMVRNYVRMCQGGDHSKKVIDCWGKLRDTNIECTTYWTHPRKK